MWWDSATSLQGAFPSSPTPPAEVFSFGNDSPSHLILALLKTAVISLGFRAWEPFKRGVSVSYCTLGPLDVSIWFSEPDILGVCRYGVDPRGWGAWCGAPTLHASRGSACLMRSLLCAATGVRVLARVFLCLPYPSRCGLFYPLLWRRCSAGSQVLLREHWSIYNCIFVVSVGGSKFRLFACHNLEPQFIVFIMWLVVEILLVVDILS